jgi:hypothetical protein
MLRQCIIHNQRRLQRQLRNLAVSAMSVLIIGCSSTIVRKPPAQYAGKDAITNLYVYSYLDCQEIFSSKFLEEVRKQLPAALEARGVHMKQLYCSESPVRKNYALLEKQGSTKIPVAEVISENRENEEVFNTSHRLIIFPYSTSWSNQSSYYNVQWNLVETKTNEVVWTVTTFSSHMRWFMGDEFPADRAKDFVEGIVNEMEKSNIFVKHR